MSKKRDDEHTATSTVVCSSPKVDNFRDNSITNIDSSTLAKTDECEAVVKPIRFWPQLIQERQTSMDPGQRKRCSRNVNRIRTFWQATKTIEAIKHKSYDKRPYVEVRLLCLYVHIVPSLSQDRFLEGFRPPATRYEYS